MPYVQMNTNACLTDAQIKELETGAAELITLLPNKKIESTMVEIGQSRRMYFACSEEVCMKVKVELYNESPFENRKQYAEELMKKISSITDIPESRIYLTFSTYDHWGRDGILKGGQ